jgi:glucuronate isomerase
MLHNSDVYKRLKTAIDDMELIDCHTHLRWHQPSAETLTDIFSYHYIATELVSAGMNPELINEDLPAKQQFLNATPYIPRIQNTTTWWGFMQICKHLFDFESETINAQNAESLYENATKKLQQPNWYLNVLEQIKIRRAFLTNEFDEDLEGYNKDVFIPALRVDGWINQITDVAVVQRLAACTNSDIHNLAAFKQAARQVAERFKGYGAVSMAISLPPDFSLAPVADSAAESAFQKILAWKRLDDQEVSSLRANIFYHLVELCQQFDYTFQLMLGVDREVYVSQKRDGFSTQLEMIKTFLDVLNRYPDVTFDFTILNTVLAHELAVVSKLFPNCVISGHWWYTFYPSLIKRILRERLEIIPYVKLNGLFTDAYYVEWCIAKVLVYKQALTEVLAGLVIEGYITEQIALEVAKGLLWENPRRNFGI